MNRIIRQLRAATLFLAACGGWTSQVAAHEPVIDASEAGEEVQPADALESEPLGAPEPPLWQPQPGLEQSWLQYQYASVTFSPDGYVSGSYNGRKALIETVLSRASDAMTLRYELPRDENGDAQGAFWYFPVEIRKLAGGGLELADPSAVQARIEGWLKERDLPREVCGVWTHGGGFPFKYDCDPQSAIEQVEPFDLRMAGIEAGKEYSHPLGLKPVAFQPSATNPTSLEATFTIDPEKARAQEVDQKLILAQMLGNELSREQAIADAAKVDFEGTITLRFDFDISGAIVSRTAETIMAVTRPDIEPETTRSINMVTRHSQEPDHDTAREFINSFVSQDLLAQGAGVEQE